MASLNSRTFFHLVCALLLVVATSANGAMTVPKKEGRFTVNLAVEDDGALMEVDKTGLLKKFELSVQWWTLLGEPVEYYDFRWFASNSYRIDGKTVRRQDLEKHPDLLKRFDSLRPDKIDVLLTGTFAESEKGVKTVPALMEPFYSKGNYRLFRHTDFKYLVEDQKLMVTKSGAVGRGIVPGSPRDWEHFLQFAVFTTNGPNNQFWTLLKDNNSLNGAARLNEAELGVRRKQLQKAFQEVRALTMHANVVHLEWPVREMRAIGELYEKYEKGIQQPSPKELVETRQRTEVETLNEYSRRDSWGQLPALYPPKIVKFSGTDNNFGLREEHTGEIIIPANYNVLEQVGDYYAGAHAEIDERRSHIFDKWGKVIVEKPFDRLRKTHDGYEIWRSLPSSVRDVFRWEVEKYNENFEFKSRRTEVEKMYAPKMAPLKLERH